MYWIFSLYQPLPIKMCRRRPLTQLNQYGLFEKAILGQKSSPVSGNRPVENFFISYSPAQSNVYQSIYFIVSNKKPHTNKNQTRMEKQKKQKKKRRKKFVLIGNIYVENPTRYDDMVWEFSLCTFNLRNQSTKRTYAEKQTLEKICIYLFIFCSRWKPRTVNAVKMSLYVLCTLAF